MNTTARLLVWFATQSRIVRYLTAAVLLHAGLVVLLGTIKIVHATIVADPPYKFGGPLPTEPVPPSLEPPTGTDGTTVSGPIEVISKTPEPPRTLASVHLPEPIIGIPGTFGRPASELALGRPSTTTHTSIRQVTGIPKLGGTYASRCLPKLIVCPGRPTGTGPTRQTETSVLAALRWLQNNQEADGSWKSPRSSHAVTGLALLAFLAHGETADSADFGATVGKGLGFLVAALDSQGFVPGRNMYAQAIVTLALCEGYALTGSPSLRGPAENAVRVLLAAQRVSKTNPQHTGGWRYTPTATDADTSLTGWAIMALEAASHAGLDVPRESLQSAGDYLWKMRGQAGFGYSSAGDNPNMTAVATFCLQFLGFAEDHRLKTALDLLKKQEVSWEQAKGSYVLYGWYYTTLAMFQGGGSYWESWNQQIARTMIDAQADDGSWPAPPQSTGEASLGGLPVYSTALGAMILETYYRYQPLYLTGKKKAG